MEFQPPAIYGGGTLYNVPALDTYTVSCEASLWTGTHISSFGWLTPLGQNWYYVYVLEFYLGDCSDPNTAVERRLVVFQV
jgi:hypothetical protein